MKQQSISRTAVIVALATAGLAGCLAAQTAPAGHVLVAAAEAAYEACVPGGAAGRTAAEMKAAADEAEHRFRELVQSDARPLDARVGLAQVLIRCQLPHASPMRVMALVEEAERELRAVLAEAPDHWPARFLLAMTLQNMPAMLGRGAAARQELERLIAQQGTRPEGPHQAMPFVFLGDHHRSAGRMTTAVETWRRGLALHPGFPLLVQRLVEVGVAPEPDSAWLEAGAPPPGGDRAAGGGGLPVIALAPLRIETSNHQFHETRSGTTLRRLDIYTMPGGTGEMLQALQAMPGATRATDGAELYIRGGDPAETPVFFDGGRLAFPGRWESLHGTAMGVVDASVLRRAYFSSGGFSARYGNALSGVVDVETEGRPAGTSYRLGANMVQVGGSVRAPVSPTTGVWGTLSGSDTRIITAMNGEQDIFTRSPQSVQGIGGLSYEPVPSVELRATALSLGDRFVRRVSINGYDGEMESGSTMQHAALSGRALRPDGRRGVTASGTLSRRHGSMRLGVLDREREDMAVGGRIDGDALAGARTRVRAGAEAMRYGAMTRGHVPASPSLAPGAPFHVLTDVEERATHLGGYLEAEYEPVPGLAVAAGVRADRLPGEDGLTVDPRVAAAYTAGDWTVRVGGGVYHQGSWRARYRLPDPGQPAGVPLRARHLVAGVERGGAVSMRVEGYVKAYDDFVAAGAGPLAVAGTNTGIDAIVRYTARSGPGGWVAWSLLRGRVELEDGAVVPSALDVTHSVTAVARMPLSPSWEVGTTGRYATGRPFTPVVGGVVDPETGAPLPTYGALHADRLPDHARLDARLTRYLFARDRTGVIYLEMLNLLDRRNVMSYTWGDDFTTRVPVNAFFAHRTFVLGVELQLN
jgi:vitamin B12 transporter